MAALRGGGPELRAYFRRHSLLQIYEALLCGVIVMRPEDPLRFLEEKLREMMEKGIDAVLWYLCIDSSLHPKLKRISETHLDTLFGVDAQLMTEELCTKAWNFYSRNLMKLYFGGWIKYNLLKKNKRKKAEQKMALAVVHYNVQILKPVIQKWSVWVRTHNEKITLAASRLQDIFNKINLSAVLKAWHAEAHSSSKTNAYFASLAKESQKGFSDSNDLTVKHKTYRFPEKALLQIFHYVNLVDLARCAQVSQAWMLLTQNSSLWSDINFSSVKHKVQDKIVVNILQKWRPCVLRLNLRGCYSLHWPSFKCISECRNLQDLNLSECQGLNDESMRLIAEGCRSLLYLNLSYTNITNGTLQLLSRNFPNLQYLSLAHCRKFTDKGLQYLGTGTGCHKLIYLDLSGCIQISVDGFRNIANGCSGIQDLLINEMPTLTDRCIQALVQKCRQITSVVFLDSPHLSDTTFKALTECKLVKVRIEGNNQITDLSFKMMSKCCQYIRHIHFAGCPKITDVGLKMISKLKNILVLNVADCLRISDRGVRPFVRGSSGAKLRELNLANCIHVTDASVKEIAERCHQLTYLNLHHCENVTDAGIEALGNMLSVISIDLSGTCISDKGLRALAHHGKIKQLSLLECKNISDTGLQVFCKGTKHLEYCHVSCCPQLTDEAVKALAFHCHRLTSVSIAGCPKMTDTCILYLASACHYLHFLDISGCINLTDKALKCLWKGCKQLQILKMLYCRNITKQAVLKYTAKLEQQDYSDADPPSWLGYDRDGNVPSPKSTSENLLEQILRNEK
ncbi:dynein regulatory complex subunit 6 isoform X1 [Gallus gallus]|uniref:dynein regulatory complex subunit 6 isoform X1 n=2 Tax=Gallus gallus TaxID=9031 RepID=UPI0002C884EB|nr:dynein regulatory complex subunit 6 isoform X1 [Gallus gallus]|eukprot:XP_415966.4 dynein regulatory complex subunit 6 isoform X1 [Gallus gallus]